MVITLLTDFGTQDVFVGVMKGVIASIAPEARCVDLTHHVPPQDIGAGAWSLAQAVSCFPPGTVHLAVVDPGVGTSRRPIAARIGDQFYVCPDNGLLTHVLSRETLQEAVVLDNPKYHRLPVSRTFHGRDIFAPAAAHLARGIPLHEIGTPTDVLCTLPMSSPEVSDTHITAHAVMVDVFGNVLLDVTEDMRETWNGWTVLLSGGVRVGIVSAYGDVAAGEALAVFGSSGHLEIAVRNGHAARRFALSAGDVVRLEKTGP